MMGALVVMFVALQANADIKNGFDLSDSLVPEDEIWRGGVPRDGIPSIDQPKFVAAANADFMDADDRVLGIERNGVIKAYPIDILDHHEVVNDRFGDEAVLVSYCPLCNTGMAFVAQAADGRFTFGVSGLLYNSDVLFYDRQTGSLWSQMLAQAISGPMKGVEMPPVTAAHTTWRGWLERHPETLVLSRDTGYRRNYNRSPYLEYRRGGGLMFPVAERNRSFRNKELALGIIVGNTSKAYPFSELSKQRQSSFVDVIDGQQVTIEWSSVDQYARVLNEEGDELPSVIAYWFAWFAFNPDTEIYRFAD